MTGLVLKDLYNISRYLKTLLFMLGVFAAIFIPQSGGASYVGMSVLMCSIMVITTMSYDEMAKWDKYALTMPVTRRDIVLSKYIILILFCLFGALIGLSVGFVVGLFTRQFVLSDALLVALISMATALIFFSMILPLLYKFGVEKARIIMIVIMMLPSVLIVGGVNLLRSMGVPMPSEDSLKILLVLYPVFSLIALALSYRISAAIYEKKEF